MLALTLPWITWAHKLPAGLKLGGLCLFTVLIFPARSPVFLLIALLVVAGLYLSLGKKACGYGLKMLKPLIWFIAIVAIWHLITSELVDGLNVILRMLAAVALANFVTMTTRLDDLIGVVSWLCHPLLWLGGNPQAVSMAIALVIRFIPVLADKSKMLLESWRSRSARRPGWQVIVPICLLATDDADHIAEALKARGGLQKPQ